MRRRISWTVLLIAGIIGVAIGLTYTWLINPVIEFDTAPWQLDKVAGDDYIGMIALAYQYDLNLARAEQRLEALSFNDPGLAVARRACEFFRRAEREEIEMTLALVELAHAFGEPTCADIALGPGRTLTPEATVLIVAPTVTPTPTLTATPTATPLPTATLDIERITPTTTLTATPAGPFEVASTSSFCNPRFPGALEVYVRDADDSPIPGMQIRVTWDEGRQEDFFYTGLQPNGDLGFANFTMQPGKSYRVELPGRSSTSPEIQPQPCPPTGGLEDGEIVLSGYAIIFKRFGE